MSVPKRKLEIVQGETFRKTLYWYHGVDVAEAITAITPGYPTIATAAAHGLPLTSAVPVTVIGKSTWLNTPTADLGDRMYATAISADQFHLPVDSTGKTYSGGNYVIYTPPVDLTEWSGRMQIRKNLAATDFLVELTTENGGMVLGADGAVTLIILDVNTSALDFTAAIGQPELISPAGDVTRLANIHFTLDKEGTR